MMVANILPVAAASANDSRQTYLKIGVGGAVVVGAVVLIRSLVVNNKAAKLERSGGCLALPKAGGIGRAVLSGS